MSRLLRNRWLSWSLGVVALVALGVGIYQIQPQWLHWVKEIPGVAGILAPNECLAIAGTSMI